MESLAHSRYDCKYHLVFVHKFWKKAFPYHNSNPIDMTYYSPVTEGFTRKHCFACKN